MRIVTKCFFFFTSQSFLALLFCSSTEGSLSNTLNEKNNLPKSQTTRGRSSYVSVETVSCHQCFILFSVFPGLLAMVAVLHLIIYCPPMSHVCFVLQPTRSSKRSRLSCEDEERPLASRSPRRSQRVTAVPQVRDVQDVFLVRRIDGSFDMMFGEIAFSF